MTKEPWKTKDWFVSPWNFADEVTAQFNFPEDIKIHDITLRDGEQQTGVTFNFDEIPRTGSSAHGISPTR